MYISGALIFAVLWTSFMLAWAFGGLDWLWAKMKEFVRWLR